MARSTPAQELARLLAEHRFDEAMQAAEQWVLRQPGVLAAWLALARAGLGLGVLGRADEAAAEAVRLAPRDPEARFYRALIDHRLARTEPAAEAFRQLAVDGGPFRTDASILLAETLHRAGRTDDFRAHMDAPGDWQADPRAALHRGYRLALDDRPAAIDWFRSLADSGASAWIRRFAGFDAVRLLDAAGRYREAWEMATSTHARTGSRGTLEDVRRSVESQRDLLRPGRVRARAPQVHGLAMVVSMPRSGTTLLEQMLDRHPSISGIGEYDGLQNMVAALSGDGGWEQGLASLGTDDAAALQRGFLEGARGRARPGAPVLFDKTLLAWQCLPVLATVLPGTVSLHMARDPRDTAVSLFLNAFHPEAAGWTSSMTTIREAIELERSILPDALATLGLPHEAVVYEHLVEDPAGVAARCLSKLGLAMDPAVLAPEENRRTIHTLSHEQVRRPINRGSIGRWRNYEWAFGPEWDALVRIHERRLAGQA